MSNLSTFFPGGGGGTPINGLASLYKESLSDGVYANVITTDNDEVYLKTGVMETNTSLYPDAATSLEPVSFHGTFDLNALTGGSSFEGISYDGTNLWVLSNGNNTVYPITTGTSPTSAGTAIAISNDEWRGVGVNIGSTELVVMSRYGNWERRNTSTGAVINNGSIGASYQHEWRGFGGVDGDYYGVQWSAVGGYDRAGGYNSFGDMASNSAIFTGSLTGYSPSSVNKYSNTLYTGGGYGIQKLSTNGEYFSGYNNISNGGTALALDGTYMYVTSGSLLYIYNLATVVGTPYTISSSLLSEGSALNYGTRLATNIPLYMRVK